VLTNCCTVRSRHPGELTGPDKIVLQKWAEKICSVVNNSAACWLILLKFGMEFDYVVVAYTLQVFKNKGSKVKVT